MDYYFGKKTTHEPFTDGIPFLIYLQETWCISRTKGKVKAFVYDVIKVVLLLEEHGFHMGTP